MAILPAYEQLMKGLAAQVSDGPFASEADEDANTSKRLLLHPAEAAGLFTDPISLWDEGVLREAAAPPRSSCYTPALYQKADETALADAVADLAFAQLHRKPVEHCAKPAGEYESAVSFVLGIYLVLALLINGLGISDFDRLFFRARTNYYLNIGSRTIRQLYDKNWAAKYTPRHNPYPLG